MGRAQKIKNRIKNSSFFGMSYLTGTLILVKFLQLFINPNEKQILFISYSGRQYSDTPKEAYNMLRTDPDFADYELVWALNKPKLYKQPELGRKISSNSPTFFYHLLKSKYWIANSSIDRLIPFEHKKHIYIQFWHGVPLKALGHSEVGLSKLVQYWYDHVQFDFMFTYSDYDLAKFREVFPRTKQFVTQGQLRKNIVKRYEQNITPARIKYQLGIKSDKPVLLYLPTFRGYDAKEQTNLTQATLAKLSENYTVIYRGHYFTDSMKQGQIITAENYSLYKLFMIADTLITDFSSVFFDFSVYGKKIYLFQPDVTEYCARRGIYLDAKKDLNLPVAYSEVELMQLLQEDDYDYHLLQELTKKYNPHDGDEAAAALKNILMTFL
ncbi:CDP-glycerol glycerophosphotransferase family protein [Weissella sagaensis]|uniref:CDP-glycerol glycerophosphotransferase family protein n=1 Tax=Weissella sagaensis TaxID=2559928 RepID=UPI0013EDE74B|nr:CDP-glycerol glycerophosphotransferase family protein [Weissella sagaensis]